MQANCLFHRKSIIATALFFTFSKTAFAQGDGSAGSVYVIAVLIIIGALILVSAILTLSENLIQIEAQKSGVGDENAKLSLAPSLSNLWTEPSPSYTGNDPVHMLKKGFDIKLAGEAEKTLQKAEVSRYAVRPTNFRGLSPIPRLVVEVGDEVKAGDVLFHDKKDDSIKYVSPVSGEIVEIRRGEKRAITDVIILADKKTKYKRFDPPSIIESSRNELVQFLLKSGGWAMLNQRPYDTLPEPESIPANIFITTFDSAPLGPDMDFIVEGKGEVFQKGIDVLNRLTDGKVYLGLNANGESAPNEIFKSVEGVARHWFRGEHPSGNVGVQIHHTAPIRPGKKVWTVQVQDVITIGELFFKGQYNAERVVAVTGAKVKTPMYYRTHIGANVGELLKNQVEEGRNRMIAGDALSGRKVTTEDFLDIRTDQITVIEEGDYYEMFGWLLPLTPRPSVSKSFPNFLFSDLKFDGDTNTHGDKRAFVVTGQYEKVLPMKIYPQHLMKAIMTGDFELMEGLGIHEMTEEDIALCEFTCTSKMPLQKILRDGLEMMREQS